MSNLIERMSFIVPVTCISFIFVIFSVNLYTKIRKIFPIKVNCWFCNKNASVPYSDYNSWNCTHCMQYNGFDKDGDYNCDIPAQRSIQLNKRWKTGEIDKRTASVASNPQKNRLCDRCNRNQELKIQQLASFEPIVKENFDMEIEDFRVKLEKSYELCYNCQRSVKKTLNRIMSNVLGLRLAQIGGKGLQVLDLHAKRTDSKERIIFNRICLGAITVLSVWNLFNSSHNVHLSRNHFDTYFPPYATNFALTFISFISAIKLLVMEYLVAFTTFSVMIFKQMCSYFTEDKFDFFNSIIDTNDFQINFVINLVAVLLSLKLVLAKCSKRLYSLLLLFLWNVNMLWSTIAGSMVNQITGNLLNFFFGVIIMVVAITLNYTLFEEATYKCPSLNNSFHRIFASCDEDLSDDEYSFNNNDYRSSSSSRRDYEQSISPDVTSKSWEDLFQDDTNRLKTGKDNRNSVWYQQQQQYNRDFSERNLTNERLYSPFCIPDDCQNKLIDLKIGGMNGRNHRVITCSSPAPSILINDRDRSQLLTPARLNFNDYSPFSASATKTSWVAGGFFVKNLSPQKRQQPIHPISRTSSQSSGFESRASSIHNGYTNGSRESSVAGDAASYYLSDNITTTRPPSSSSPISFYDCPVNDSFSLFTKKQTFNSTLCKPESENDFCLTNYAYDKNIKPLSKSVYHQFGTHRLNLNDSGSVSNRFSHHSVNLCKGNIDETNLFNSNC